MALMKCTECGNEYDNTVKLSSSMVIAWDGYSSFNVCSIKCAFRHTAYEMIHGEGIEIDDIITILKEIKKEE